MSLKISNVAADPKIKQKVAQSHIKSYVRLRLWECRRRKNLYAIGIVQECLEGGPCI